MNGSISGLFFDRIVVPLHCAVIVLCREGVIANFDVVRGLKRHLHCIITLVYGNPAGTCTLVSAGILRLRRRRSWKGWRCMLYCLVATPPPDANDIRQWVWMVVLLFRLLLVHLGDDVVDRAVCGT